MTNAGSEASAYFPLRVQRQLQGVIVFPHHVDRRKFRLMFLCLVLFAAVPGFANDVDDLAAQAHKAMTTGNPQQAVSLLNQAIDAAPTRADLYLLRSRALDSTGKMDAALADASKYIELEPSDAFGYLSRAHVYMSLEKYQQALDDATKAIELDPNEPDGYYRRSDIYNDMGRKAQAKADEAKAEELDKLAR